MTERHAGQERALAAAGDVGYSSDEQLEWEHPECQKVLHHICGAVFDCRQ